MNVLGLIQFLSKFINKTSTDLEKCKMWASVSFPGAILQYHIMLINIHLTSIYTTQYFITKMQQLEKNISLQLGKMAVLPLRHITKKKSILKTLPGSLRVAHTDWHKEGDNNLMIAPSLGTTAGITSLLQPECAPDQSSDVGLLP